MIGWPGQGEDEIIEAIDFVHRLGAQVRIAEFTPIPHTREGNRPPGSYRSEEDDDPLLHNNTYYSLAAFARVGRQIGVIG